MKDQAIASGRVLDQYRHLTRRTSGFGDTRVRRRSAGSVVAISAPAASRHLVAEAETWLCGNPVRAVISLAELPGCSYTSTSTERTLVGTR